MVLEDAALAGRARHRTSSHQPSDEEPSRSNLCQHPDEEPNAAPGEECSCVAAPPHTRPLQPSAKDTRYGWVVVGATFVINVVVAGYIKSFGLLYRPIMQQFPGTSTASAGLMLALMTGFRGILAPLNGALIVVLGPRVCATCGGLLAALGFLLALPVASITHLACTIGGLVGVGMSMSETPGFIVISEYFEERRSLANGFRASGNPFGGVVFPFIMVFLIQEFPLKGVFMMLAGIMLHICVLGMLLRPFHVHKTMVEREHLKALASSTHGDQDIDARQTYTGIKRNESVRKKPLDFALLKNPVYLVYIVMIGCTNASLANVLYYVTLYGTSIGLAGIEISFMVAVISILDTLSRMFIGWICDKSFLKRRHVFIFGHMIAGLSCLLVCLTKSYWFLLAVVSLHSVGVAAFWALINTLLADQFGENSQPTAWGFFRMAQGTTSFIYPSLLGLLADVSGWMGTPFLFMGCMYFVGGLVFALQPLVMRLSGIRVDLT